MKKLIAVSALMIGLGSAGPAADAHDAELEFDLVAKAIAGATVSPVSGDVAGPAVATTRPSTSRPETQVVGPVVGPGARFVGNFLLQGATYTILVDAAVDAVDSLLKKGKEWYARLKSAFVGNPTALANLDKVAACAPLAFYVTASPSPKSLVVCKPSINLPSLLAPPRTSP